MCPSWWGSSIGRLTAHRTMARSFSLALNDLFKIDNSLADLDAAVYEKCVTLSYPANPF